MNKGIRLASKDRIIFMNSGDIFYNSNVLKKISKICSNNPDSDIIFGDTVINTMDIKYKVNSKYFNNSTLTMPFCHQSSIVKTYLMKKKLFKTQLNLSSDFNFFFSCFLKKYKFFKYNGVISIIKSGGKSDTLRQKVLSENIQIFFKEKALNKIIILYLLKLYEFLKTIFKILLPVKLRINILKIKYFKKII